MIPFIRNILKNIIYYSIGLLLLYLINLNNNPLYFNYFLLTGFYLLINTIALKIYFGRFIFLIKLLTLYLIIIFRYIHINAINGNNIFNILYVLNLLTIIQKINKLGLIRLNNLNITDTFKLILSSNIYITFIFQYIFYTNINDIVYLLPLLLSHLFLYFEVKELWILSYSLSIYLLNIS